MRKKNILINQIINKVAIYLQCSIIKVGINTQHKKRKILSYFTVRSFFSSSFNTRPKEKLRLASLLFNIYIIRYKKMSFGKEDGGMGRLVRHVMSESPISRKEGESSSKEIQDGTVH